MTTVNAWAADSVGGPLKPFQYSLGPIGADEVDIAIDHCGICHSDLSMIDNSWGFSQYPLVPGHEVVGRVSAVGSHVTHLSPGALVGLGWQSGYCMTCPQCMSGHHNTCPSLQMTIVGRHGGFADIVRAQAASVIALPAGLDVPTAGPLFCGGITVFNPIDLHGIKPTDRVAVIGIGGLGHLAIQFLNAWGCEVTAFSSSGGKADEAKALGAHQVVNSRNPDELAALAGRFDMILSTVNVPLDWNAYVQALTPRGRLHFVGAVTEPISLGLFPLLLGERTVSSSPVGAPATLARMLEFAARHRVKPVVEHFPMSQVNAALDHLRAGGARYRIVLDRV